MIKDKDKKMISNSVKGWNFMVIRIIIENMYPSLTVFIQVKQILLNVVENHNLSHFLQVRST